jgi:hypothetical protein
MANKKNDLGRSFQPSDYQIFKRHATLKALQLIDQAMGSNFPIARMIKQNLFSGVEVWYQDDPQGIPANPDAKSASKMAGQIATGLYAEMTKKNFSPQSAALIVSLVKFYAQPSGTTAAVMMVGATEAELQRLHINYSVYGHEGLEEKE